MKSDVIHGSESHRAMDHYMASLIRRRDFAGAIKYYEDNRNELVATGGAASGSILHHVAVAYTSLSNYPAALKTARVAEHLVAKQEDSKLLAEVFVTLGGILRELGKWKEAEKAFRDAESIFRRQDFLEGQSRALNLLAGLFYKKADYHNALAILVDAIALAQKSHNQKQLAYMMGNIGRIYTFLGNVREAHQHLQTSIELSTRLSDWLEVTRTHLALGYLYIQQAAYDKAEQTLTHAHQHIATMNIQREEVIYLTYLGELRYRRGRLHEAAEALNEALTLAEKMAAGPTLAGRVRRHLAELYVRQKNYSAARRVAARAMLAFEEAEVKSEIGALWKIKAVIAEANGQDAKGREYVQNAIDILKQAGVRFEWAEALTTAGSSTLFSARQRLTYLFRAEEFYRRNGVTAKLREVERIINSIEYPAVVHPPAVKTDPRSASCHPDENVDYLTNCHQILRFKTQLTAIGRSDLPLLLSGETGVGKDRMARYYHHLVRPETPFVTVNCVSLPEALLESELFGYVKGAFTGAESDKQGLFVAANRGVLYLDEIGDMPQSLQAKLLGVLETRCVVPLGSTDEVKLDIKLVAASNKDLKGLVEHGAFRRDLYYRLTGITFHIPPLRERKEDIPLLLRHFMQKCNLPDNNGNSSAKLAHLFVEYDWPGNIRELYNEVKRLEVMAELVAEGDLVELSRSIFPTEMPQKEGSFFDRVEQFERTMLVEALLATGGNKSEAARILGIHEATVRSKLKRYRINVEGGVVH